MLHCFDACKSVIRLHRLTCWFWSLLLFSFTNSFSSGLECDGTVSSVVVGFFTLKKWDWIFVAVKNGRLQISCHSLCQMGNGVNCFVTFRDEICSRQCFIYCSENTKLRSSLCQSEYYIFWYLCVIYGYVPQGVLWYFRMIQENRTVHAGWHGLMLFFHPFQDESKARIPSRFTEDNGKK